MRLLLAGFLTLASVSAASADGPYEPPPPVTPWAGFYFGTSMGGLWSDFSTDADSGSPTGGVAGGQIGYNWQVDRLVFGIEGDLATATADEATGDGLPERFGIDWTGAIRARLGYDLGGTLIYGAAGLAAAGIEIDEDTSIGSDTFWGWTVGAGVETKITPNLALRADYRYADFGSDTVVVDGTPVATDVTGHQFMVGFNYYLGAGVSPMSLVTFAPPAGATSWSGSYFGGLTGYVWGDGRHTEVGGGSDGNFDFDGWTAGLRAGYDWQAGGFVYGLVTDFSLADAEDRGEALDNRIDLERIGVDYLGTIRARAGFTLGSSLIYATGGAAYAGLDLYDDGDNSTKGMWGWTAGGGLETFIGANQSISLEYLYADFGSETFNVDGDARRADLTTSIVRVGISQRF
jgi:outer membrane immunogenic protein